MSNTQRHIPFLGHHIVLVPREQLRRREHGRTLRVPYHLKAVAATIPTPPVSWDGSKGRTIKYPVLGNNQYGDCYYADACHCVQTFTGNAGSEAVFDPAAVVARYLKISGGDNGLGDQDIFPEWKSGIVGPGGPHKILDDMTVDPRDDGAIRLGISRFCGGSYTAALFDAWLANPSPGQVWDAVGQPNQQNGHAMHLSGYVLKGAPLPFDIPGHARAAPSPDDYYFDETWGFDTPILLKPAGLKASDPEVTIQFSVERYNSQGIDPVTNTTYDQDAALWVSLGGHSLPPSPFAPPSPAPPGPTPGPSPVKYPEVRAVDEDVFNRLVKGFHGSKSATAALNLARGDLEKRHAALFQGRG